MTHNKPSYLTTDEVAKRLRVTPQTIINKIKSGEIEGAYRFGKVYRIPLDVVEEYISTHEIQTEER